MRAIATVLIVVTLMSGCSQRAGGIGIGVGLGIVVCGGVLASNPSGDARSDMGAAMGGGAIAGIGGVVALASLIGMAVGPPSPSSPPQARAATVDPKDEADRTRRRQVAIDLTATAKTAALTDDCATVENLGRKVLAVDREIHRTVFLIDAAIARCLGGGAASEDRTPPATVPTPDAATPP